MKTIVVGAGVIGASIAWHLDRAGCEVVVIDGGQPAASSHSFGWINASFFADTAHHRLRVAGIEAYRRLARAVPDAPITTTGALWWEGQGAALQAMKASLQRLNYPVEELTAAQVAADEPTLAEPPQEALRFSAEGCAEVAELADVLLASASAPRLQGVTVQGIRVDGGVARGVETSVGTITADRVVIAAGNGAPDILASAGVSLPMLVRPGVLVKTKPITGRINHVLVTPHGEARQLPDGRMLASAVANHQGDDASEVADHPDAIAARVLGWLGPMVGQEVTLDEVAVAYRPVPRDGLPVVGAVEPKGLHVAVMHSGATLAAIIGEITADEVLGKGDHSDLVAPYRPQRFQ